MHVTIRRYEGVDQARTEEVTRRVNETLLPKLRQLDGFKGFYLVEAGNGVVSSLGLFENADQIPAATALAATWIRDEKLEQAIPNAPTITSGKVLAHSNGVVA
jgi:hypothetical protein